MCRAKKLSCKNTSDGLRITVHFGTKLARYFSFYLCKTIQSIAKAGALNRGDLAEWDRSRYGTIFAPFESGKSLIHRLTSSS